MYLQQQNQGLLTSKLQNQEIFLSPIVMNSAVIQRPSCSNLTAPILTHAPSTPLMTTINLQNQSSPFIIKGQVLNVNPNDLRFHTGFWDIKNFYYEERNDLIAEGGFGKIFRGRHRLTSATFAIKKVNRKSLVPNGSNESYLSREIGIQMNINHPNIVRLYTFYSNSEDTFLIMENCEGGTLSEKLEYGRLDEMTAFRIFIQIASAVKFLHENNVAHRDIKTENILFDTKGHPKLADFGWANKINPGELRKTFCGTYEYMSPEMIRECGHDKTIDVWALGVLLYEMLHGHSPFNPISSLPESQQKLLIFSKILSQNYSISPNLSLSPECVNIITRLLHPNHHSRLTIDQIFTHPWVRKMEPLARQILGFEENLKEENERRKLRKMGAF